MTTDNDRATRLFDRAAASGISLEWLAAVTGKSFATVYAYKVGRRTVQSTWLAEAEVALEAHDNPPHPRGKVA